MPNTQLPMERNSFSTPGCIVSPVPSDVSNSLRKVRKTVTAGMQMSILKNVPTRASLS